MNLFNKSVEHTVVIYSSSGVKMLLGAYYGLNNFLPLALCYCCDYTIFKGSLASSNSTFGDSYAVWGGF